MTLDLNYLKQITVTCKLITHTSKANQSLRHYSLPLFTSLIVSTFLLIHSILERIIILQIAENAKLHSQ